MSGILWPSYEQFLEETTIQGLLDEWDFRPLNLMWADEHDIANTEAGQLDLGGLALLGETSEGVVYAVLIDEEDFEIAEIEASPVIMIAPDGVYRVVAPDFISFLVLMTESAGTPEEFAQLEGENESEIEEFLESMREEIMIETHEFGMRILDALGIEDVDVVNIILDTHDTEVEL